MIESFIFTCSTGRCGTAYLASLFDAKHEPQPKLMQEGNVALAAMTRDVAANGNQRAARDYLSTIKLPHIERTCDRRVYFETAHTFSKGFLLPLIDLLGTRLKIIRVRRRSTDVVNSLMRLGTIPPGNAWYLRGTDAICVDRMSEEAWSGLSDREKCIWYVEEIENQWSRLIKPRLSKGQWFEVNLEDMLVESHVLRELEAFVGLPLVSERIGRRLNARR